METFLDAFYYGNIDLKKRDYQDNGRVLEISKKIKDSEKELIDRYTADEKQNIIDLIDNYNELREYSEKERFITGFRIGAMFAFETFQPLNALTNDFFDD